jgi:cobalt-zinc-cadmium efflux system protein
LITSTPGVVSVHDLHVWALTSGKTSLTAHVVHDATNAPDVLIDAIKIKLADQYKVFHTTLQLEIKPCEHTDDGCNFIDPRSPVVTQ